MRLSQLVAGLDGVELAGDAEVASATHDSRRAGRGSLYCCIPGRRVDGHDFAADAVARGATALLCERPLALDVAQAHVPAVRPVVGPVCSRLHGDPSTSIPVVGVTGTDGKSTTVGLVAHVLEACGRPTAVMGNLASADADPTGARPSNTPEAPDLQAALARAVESGARAVAMEVTSPALDQRRVDGTRFAVAVFTNLSRDHLDYHGTMEAYFEAKARLFTPALADRAVVNADDEAGRRIAASTGVACTTYSLDDAAGLELSAAGSRFGWRGHEVRLRLAGAFNVMNALAAATACAALGVDEADVAGALSSARPAPGRLEPVDEGQPFGVLVDYAHTANGLEQVLRAAAAASGRPPLVVFGCGGDRDATKRPLMGEVAARLCRLVVLTSDNPRSEDPLAIIEAVRAGAVGPARVTVEPDRRAAIEAALREARPGEVVVIAGKGHETGQTAGGVTVPFDDRLVAAELLRSMREAAP